MDSGWSSELDLLLGLDAGDGLRHGIEHSLRKAIRGGRLSQGAALPSSRALARDLKVARGTVSAAYSQLAAEGYLAIRQGAPARVSWTPPRRLHLPPSPSPKPRRQWDLRPGRPDSASFPRSVWSRAQHHVVAQAPDEVFGYGDVCGTPQLRRALAEYLGRVRGVTTDPTKLVICNGSTHALSLICHALRARGATTLAVEDPGVPRYRQLIETSGLTVVPVPCDQDGLCTDHLAESQASAVLVTPAHQYPLGVTMSSDRRTELVEWAQRHDSLIIEDDYDGEFRYDRQPVGALQQLDPDRVIYVGTASKTLAPGLRLGWLSAPQHMEGNWIAGQSFHRGTGILEQLTLAELITSCAFDRHIRRMRSIYRRRRDELAHILADDLPHLHLAGISAGLHAVIYLPKNGPTEHEIEARAAKLSVALHTLGSYYWHEPLENRSQAVIVGYATPASHAYRPALAALTRLLT
jgi:GntR family transcriptional regulator / MocR family aminotransferase